MQNLEIKHLDQASISPTELTIDALARIAPSCITEVKDSKTGSIKHAVDFRVLRQLLGDSAVEDAAEAYQFTWVGKQEARREAAKSINKTLRPVPEDSVDWDNTQNIYIEGDNLEALKLLQKSYLGKVKMIYIDPPYNTGNDFVYHDDFKQSQSEYDEAAGNVDEEGNRLVSRGGNSSLDDAFKKNTDSNGRFHSDWCSMIYSRLMIARSLLTEDGVIFISIDDKEVDNLLKICDEIFGNANRINTICINMNSLSGVKMTHVIKGKRYPAQKEYLLLYKKGGIQPILSIEKKPKEKWDKEYNMIIPELSDEQFNAFTNMSDEEINKILSSMKLISLTEYSKATNIEITDEWKFENSYRIFGTKSNKTLVKNVANQTFTQQIYGYTNTDGNKRFFRTDYNKETKDPRIELVQAKSNLEVFISDNWTDISNDGGVAQEGDVIYPNGKKPLQLINRIVKAANTKNGLILDFFSGSSTTAHAVMLQNFLDLGTRRFIMVQIPEDLDKSLEKATGDDKDDIQSLIDFCDNINKPHNICEIGKERIRRAGAKIKAELEKANKEKGLFDDNGNGAGESKGTKLDTGFRVFRIDSGNMKDVEQSPSDVDQTELDWFIDNVKDDRTELDLLFGCMLNWGVQLSLPMSMETVDGCNIYTVNDGDLVACLTKDQPVTENIVRAIAEKSPLRVLFRDGSFASDAAKINIFEQFKQLMDWSDDEIIKNVRVL